MQKRSYTNHKKRGIADKLLYALPGVALLMVAGLAVAKHAIKINDVNAIYSPTMVNSITAGVLSEMSLGVTVDGNSILRITPDANGKFDQGDIDVTVNTSNVFGYTLKMYAYAPNSTTPTTSLTNVATSLSGGVHPTIETLASGSSYTAEQFASDVATKNKWGYKVNSDTAFRPVASETTLVQDGEYGSHAEKVTFGAKIDNTIPNGLYQVTLNFVAIAKEPSSTNVNSDFESAFMFAGVNTYGSTNYYAMQDMTSTICNYVYTPNATDVANTKSIQLIDKRDNNLYWVSKLADGKCWMTQNLDLDLDAAKALTSADTDLKVSGIAPYIAGYTEANGVISWKPSNSTIKVDRNTNTGTNGEINYGTNVGKWTNENNNTTDAAESKMTSKALSVDAGKWYETGNYFTSDVCNNVDWSTGCNWFDKTKTTTTSGASLSNYFNTSPFEGNGEHGAIGNWYNWNAAIASDDTSGAKFGLGTTPTDTDKVNSVCPKGWTLPATVDGDSTAGTYANINRLYNGSATTGKMDEGLFNAPFYGVRGGFIYYNGLLSTLYDVGRIGYYWSSTASTATYGYRLGFYSPGVNPANNDGRGRGFSVRCLAL